MTKFREKYHYTSHLSGQLKLMVEAGDKVRYTEVHKQIEHYSAAYKDVKNKVGPLSAAASFQMFIQEAVEKTLASPGAEITCKKGCNHCCHLHVDISDDEAKLILDYSEKENITIDWPRLQKQKGREIEQWEELTKEDRACVFLNNEGACNIYPVRPNACRKAMVISNPDNCDTIKNPGGKVTWVTSMPAEIVTSAISNTTKSGTMSDMLFQTINK